MSTAYGTSVQADEVTTFTNDGQVASVKDGEGNLTSFAYNGFDRLYRTYYPSTTKGAGTSSTTDYEELAYDAGGNVTVRRLRDGTSLYYSYDALGRLTFEDNPGTTVAEVDIGHGYDLLGRQTGTSDGNGWYASWGYDALGRVVSQGSALGTHMLGYDLAGRMTSEAWPDGFTVTYQYDVTGNPVAVRESGSTVTTLATFGYDALGRRTSVTNGNGTASSWAYDVVGRLNTLTHDLAGTSADLSVGYTYNPASQIATRVSSNDGYSWTGYATGTQSYTADGLNRYSAAAGATATYDARGNLTSAGGQSYGYNSRDRLYTTGTGGLWYTGPTGLLGQEPGNNLDHVGSRLTTEQYYSLARRYVYAPGGDVPLVWYEGAGTSDRRWLHTDERGSVIAVSDASGAPLAINTYDEYGQPASTNLGRFGYTGQQWLAGLGLWDYKARMYAPSLGRFMQTDPIGYGDGLNWYGYVAGDPVNRVDPSGAAGTGWVKCTGSLLSQRSCDDLAGWTCSVNCDPFIATYDQDGAALNEIRSRRNPKSATQNPQTGEHVFTRDTYTDLETKDLVVTASSLISDSSAFILVWDRYVPNPNYRQPWYDPGLDGFLAITMSAYAFAATPGYPVLPLARFKGSPPQVF